MIDSLNEVMKNKGFSLVENFFADEERELEKIEKQEKEIKNEKIRNKEFKIKQNFEEELEEFEYIEERKYKAKKRTLEKEYDDKIYELEMKMRKNYRIREEELITKENALKIKEDEIEDEIKSLEKIKKEKELEIEKLDEKILELNKKVQKIIGFKDYIDENNFIYRNKLEAVLILRKLGKRNLRILNQKEYEIIFRNIIGGVNELIKMNNLIIDYKIILKRNQKESEG